MIHLATLSLAVTIMIKRARYIGYVGFGNLGDDALFVAAKELFSEKLDLDVVTPATRAKRWEGWFGRAARVDAVLLGGGTLIKRGRSRSLGAVTSLRRAFPHAKLVVFGTGVADADLWARFGVETDRAGWRDLLEQADFVGVRGPLSRQFLKDWGVLREVEIIGDVALWFGKDKFVCKPRARRIGINLGSSLGNIHGGNEQHVLEEGARLLKRLHNEGWQITLFPVIAEDIEYMAETVKLAGIAAPEIHTDFLNLHRVLDAMEKQDLFVGEKLHSVVLATCVGTPSIMLEYRTKCLDFMRSIDRGHCTFRTDEFQADQVYDLAYHLYDNLEREQRHIHRQVQKYKCRLRVAADRVCTLLSEASR